MTDTKELKLMNAYDAAGKLLEQTVKMAREAAQARTRARRAYQRALHDLTIYRERRDAGKRPQ